MQPPDTVVHDANRQAEDLAIGSGFQRMITKAAVGLADPLDADLRMAASELLGLGEGRVAELSQGQREETFIDLGHDRQRRPASAEVWLSTWCVCAI